MSDVSERMREDWNQRAREDAHYYVAFGGRNQDEDAFLATGAEVVHAIEWELKRLPQSVNPRSRRALEIGCGPGRLMKPLSAHFGEIHGVDVSDEMIRLARERLGGIPHAHVHATNGASLAMFADESFDIVYSYAVFQHVPSREVVYEYMREISRVLKQGGVFRGQFSGLPAGDEPDTWSGVRFSSGDLRTFTVENHLEFLALEGEHTQYMWTTWRKGLPGPQQPGPPAIRRITNASSSEAVVPNAGPLAALSIWAVNLPADCDLNSLEVRIDGRAGAVVYVGAPDSGGLQQVNVILPPGTRNGLVPVELLHAGASLGQPAFARIIRAAPRVPRIISLTDGINIVERERTRSGLLKIQIDECEHPELVGIDLDGQPVHSFDLFCADPAGPRYEVNVRVPESTPLGFHELRVRVGRRALTPRQIEVLPRASG